MSVKEYSLMFFKFSEYVSSLVSSSRDKMSRFVTGISENLEKECWVAMLHDNMELYRLMLLTKQVEEIRRRKNGREGKKPRPRIRLVLALVGVRLKSRTGPSSRRGTNTLSNPTPFKKANGKGDKYRPKKGNDRNAQRD